MKFLLLTVLLCCVAFFMAASAVPIDESIPEGFGGVADDTANPSDDKSIFLKLKLLKLLLLG